MPETQLVFRVSPEACEETLQTQQRKKQVTQCERGLGQGLSAAAASGPGAWPRSRVPAGPCAGGGESALRGPQPRVSPARLQQCLPGGGCSEGQLLEQIVAKLRGKK